MIKFNLVKFDKQLLFQVIEQPNIERNRYNALIRLNKISNVLYTSNELCSVHMCNYPDIKFNTYVGGKLDYGDNHSGSNHKCLIYLQGDDSERNLLPVIINCLDNKIRDDRYEMVIHTIKAFSAYLKEN